MTSIGSNITTTIANNISSLRLQTARNTYTNVMKPKEVEEEYIYNEVKKPTENLTSTNPIYSRFTASQIQEMKDISSSMGEKLTDEDIQYALKYGRSVIADYSV